VEIASSLSILKIKGNDSIAPRNDNPEKTNFIQLLSTTSHSAHNSLVSGNMRSHNK